MSVLSCIPSPLWFDRYEQRNHSLSNEVGGSRVVLPSVRSNGNPLLVMARLAF